MAMNSGAWETVSYNSYQLNNLSSTYLKTGFQTRQYLSDYYVENASFLKMDNLSLGYNFGTIYKGCSLNVSAWCKMYSVSPNTAALTRKFPTVWIIRFIHAHVLSLST